MVSGVVFGIDQLAKSLSVGSSRIFENNRSGLILPLTALVILIVVSTRFKKEYIRTPLSLILGGGISNVVDLIVRGFVIDYLNIGNLFFNIGDIAILSGVLVLTVSLNKRKENSAHNLQPKKRK